MCTWVKFQGFKCYKFKIIGIKLKEFWAVYGTTWEANKFGQLKN